MNRSALLIPQLLSVALAGLGYELPSTDLAGCREFSALFDNTCRNDSSGYPAAVSDFANADAADKDTMSCTGTMRCPNTTSEGTYTSSSPCSFERKLCVSCSEDTDGVVKIKVQTNMMPNHCFTSTVNNAIPKDFEFEVTWQPDAT